MDKEIKQEARKQYFKYFRVWFLIAGILLAVTILASVAKAVASRKPRGNHSAAAERVYDLAEVLTPEEEENLRDAIARFEKKAHIDMVLVTINQPMGSNDDDWDDNMLLYAADFYEEFQYGYNEPYGDGAILLDNWYEDENGSQKGTALVTSGRMEDIIGPSQEDRVLDAMYDYIDGAPYRAYYEALEELAYYGRNGYQGNIPVNWPLIIILPGIVAIIYALYYSKQSKAKDTTQASTYVENGTPIMNSRADDFLRKNVVSRRIETSSGSGGSGGGHRGGGSHGSFRSSSGRSHGGGTRRR